MKMMKLDNFARTHVVIWFIIIFLADTAASQSIREKFVVGGYPGISETTPHTLVPSSNIRELRYDNLSEKLNFRANKHAKKWLKKSQKTNALLLIENGKIVFEGYKGLGREDSEFYSMSMSKSLTSLAIGKALCDGTLRGLDVLASEYVPELKPNNNNLGRSSIRQLLMMSSGNWLPVFAGQPKVQGGIGFFRNGKESKGSAWPMRLGQITVNDYIWGDVWARVKNKGVYEPGEKFIYSIADTLAVAAVLERTTNQSLAAYFETHIWHEIGAEASARWEADKNGASLAGAGFQARLKDWGRLAKWILESHSSKGCFGEYLRQSTKTQIKNAKLTKAGQSFGGYGYQWWTENKNAPGFWAIGVGGQYMGINPQSSKIIIKFSQTADDGFFNIFRKWHNE
jgi:CubicO group peptidase (beta-lactamase class C family)